LRKLLFALLVITFLCASAVAEDLVIAASANTAPVVKELATAFEARSGDRVKISLAASGTLYSQILNGAPFDVFLSADEDYPLRLEQAGLTVPATRRVYAIGRLVLWAREDSGLDVEKLRIETLVAPKARHVAIANPERAPYGAAAIQTLRHYGIYEKVQSRLVFGDSLAQAAQFVESGAADVGFIGLSLVLSAPMNGKGAYWLVPEDAHEPIRQAVVILKRGPQDRSLARRFLEFLLGPDGRSALVKNGYALPDVAENRP
jgi:molybdate transport system substrate-binding protein